MTDMFSTLHHVCVVVADIDRAVRFYESVGIGPWHDYPPLTQYVDLHVPDRDAFLDLTYKYADLANAQFQLVAPGRGESPQRTFLETHGEGVFHVGFSVPDVTAAEKSSALPVLMRGRRTDGSGFTYFDTSEHAGVTLEIRQNRGSE